ncbi:hypothetical protein EHF33_08695 [Deinococcus psychrotolerans]|uniref:DUF4064 domain-containing protein n=1 Tax=Deinococcus psychrotolerans TaxID=2489213 RepID=A0A3G8YNU7_9DEIO|nr:hypothetical protein [Deinococcus psychrotolerans]AZI42816.1 hypothetical protein EHF33_08695 [Deinococcus psychrotolerans]
MKPEKLSWVTIPLLISVILSILGMLSLPFIGFFMNLIFGAAMNDASTTASDAQALGWVKLFTGSTLWIIFFFSLAWTVFQFLTYRAIQEGKGWARIAAIVIAILGLLNFPVGTALGVFMLVGAFDPAVQEYANR